LEKSTLEPEDLPTRDRPRLVGLDKPQPDGPGYWATISNQHVWVQLCPPGSAKAPLTFREKFGAKKPAARHEQRTRVGSAVHHGGHEHVNGYGESDQKELESQLRSTRAGWASGWGPETEVPEDDA